MINILNSIAAGIAGIFIGAFFFGGLWLTVQKGLRSSTPGLWFALSFIFRMALTLAGFYYVSHGNLQKALLCVAGFIVGRIIIIRITKHDKTKVLRLIDKEV